MDEAMNRQLQTMRTSRREFIRNSCGTLAATALPGCMTADGGAVTFGLVADVHYADIDDAIGRHYREAERRLADCVREMNALKPDFLIELGDFKDLGRPAETTLDGLKRIERTFAGFDGPRYHVLGNHDCDAITPDEFLSNVVNYGQPRAKAYYSFRFGAVTFLVLDGCYTSDLKHYSRSNPWTDANIPPEQLAWLERELARADGPVIVFCHQRMDPSSEPHHLLKNAAEVRRILERSGKVRTVITGHQHTGGGCVLNGISYLTLPSVVDGEGTNAFALAQADSSGRVAIRGWGRVTPELIASAGLVTDAMMPAEKLLR